MNILITGGMGYKGNKLARKLAVSNNVTVLDDFSFSFPIPDIIANSKIEVIKKDVRELNSRDLVGFDAIYHLAGLVNLDVCEKNPHLTKSVNVDGTRRIVKLLSKNQLLIYASTTSIYGPLGGDINESATPHPQSVYAKTKYEAEKVVMERKNSLSLRLASLFGLSSKMRDDLMVHNFIINALCDKYLVIYDPKSVRTFLHIDDAVNAYASVLPKFAKLKGKVFNVGDVSLNLSKLELAREVKTVLDFEIIEKQIDGKEKRDYVIHFDKFKKELDFKVRPDLKRQITKLVKFYKLKS